MFAIFKKPAFLRTLGVLLLALFIWFAGPYFAFADYRPLGSTLARWIAIALVVIILLGSLLLKQLKAVSASKKLATAVAKQQPAVGSADAQQLRERFEEAMGVLNQNRGKGQTLYELPWYAIIGAPGSGKTTALINSGLNFPLAQRFGKEALRGVGGTRNCDWWFADEAVLLDTAGRYTTQDSDQSADSVGWREFLALLVKHRKRRPLNGVIVAISAADLMTQHAAERESHVAAVRRRLDELNRELKVQLPVYVIVTKCDLVAGFMEYFNDLSQEARRQIWGVTFPYELTTSGRAAQTFAEEFDALIRRLNERVLSRVEEERDARRRAAIFGFPRQMAALRGALHQFVQEVFAATRYDGRILLRGVYFTSGTQEGTPIDRLLGALGRSLAVSSAAVAAPGGRGKAYFVESLLKEVIFPESGLAGVNRKYELKKAALQLGAYAALVLIAAVGVLAFAVSFARNKAYLADMDAALGKLAAVPEASVALPAEQALPRWETMRSMVDTADRYRTNVPWSMRWGLYQGRAVGNAARDAYVRELDGGLLPQIAAAMRTRLVASTAEPDKLYEYLKIYLMLGQPEHLDKDQLRFMVDLEWQQAYADQPGTREALLRHFESMLAYESGLRSLPIDMQLVSQTRASIQQASLALLIFSRLKLAYAGDAQKAVRLDSAIGLGAESVLVRKSGKSLAEPVAAFYTPAVFNEISGLGTAELVNQFRQDNWVLGEDVVSLQNSARLVNEVMELYEQEYIRIWDDVLNDVQVRPFRDLVQTTNALSILAGPTSPLRGLLVTVDTHTALVKPPDPAQKPGTLDKAQQAVQKLLNTAKKTVGVAPTQPGAAVTAHFDPIRKLVAGPPGQAPIDRVLAQLGQVQQQLQSVGTGVGDTNPLEALTRSGRGDVLKSLQQEAALLPPSIKSMITQISGSSESAAVSQARSELANRYNTQVVKECREVTAGRYPFDARSSIDVPLADFGRLFGAGGVFDGFFKQNLEALVDTSRTPWTWRAGTSVSLGVSSGMLRQFEAAQRIRDSYFRPGGQLPEVKFNVTPAHLDAAASRVTLEVDGQNVEYRHGPERTVPAAWPGPSPGLSAISFEDRAGGRPNQAFQGPWALFRLIEAGSVQPQSDVRYVLGWQIGGHEARMTIEATSIRNPFARNLLRQFSCTG